MADERIQTAIFEDIATVVRERLAKNMRIRRNLPGGGRIRIDRQLPFLCVYRSPTDQNDDGTRDLVTTEASYLFASGHPDYETGISHLCRAVGETLQEHFGMFLLLELWTEDDRALMSPTEALQPGFHVVATESDFLPTALSDFESTLHGIRLRSLDADVQASYSSAVVPPNLSPLLPSDSTGRIFHIGLAVRPVYRDQETGRLFPMVLQSLRRQLGTAIRRAVAALVSSLDGEPRRHFESLGPSALVKATRLVDQQLCEISESFDFLLQVTPLNSDAAWRDFVDSGYDREPTFFYRPLPYRPSLLKRQLFETPIERLEDSTMAHLCWEKQDELDRQLTALKDIDTRNFLYDSLQLYGAPDDELVRLAKEVLSRVGPSVSASGHELARANEIAVAAREHIDYYHELLPDFHANVQVCDHIASGMMVAKGMLYISENIGIPHARVQPLLHHEVGTHLLTYFNGRKQPFRQLYAGMAGHEALQEGLAVLAEYLSGGLTRKRMRALAGRVIAVDSVIDGASFLETFRLLYHEYSFPARTAFITTLRAHRAGGLTKDAIYLKGLRDLLGYLRQGHEVEPLYVGKIALEHIPFVQELRRRGIVQPPALLPRFWNDAELQERLAAFRELTILDLVETIR